MNESIKDVDKTSLKEQKHYVKPGVLLPDFPIIPGYTIVRRLGHGSQGDVYLANRESDGLQVAIKRLNIGSVKNWKEYELFHREAEVLASLNIKGVAKFYDAIDRLEDHPPCSYIIQEYINGRSLAEIMKHGHRFSMGQVYDILRQLLNILYKLHTHEPPVIHRDIKPSNILLKDVSNGRYQVYLIDFGAVANPQVQSGGSTVAGTFGYMPPEQLMGKPEPASDIYALGALGVHLFTGKSPADMPQKDFHLIFEPEMQSFPVELVNTLRSMLEPDPQKRLWDHVKINQLFRSYLEGVYDSTGSRRKLMSPSEFDKQLKNVKAYGAAGNLELWQELDDHLPRNDKKIPACYLSFDSKARDPGGYHFYPFAVFEYSSISESKEYVPLMDKLYRTSVNVIMFIVCLFVAFFAVFFFVLLCLDQYTEKDLKIALAFSCVVCVPVALYYFFCESRSRLSKADNHQQVNKKTKLLKANANHYYFLPEKPLVVSQDKINALLKHGRKTIATIVFIDYYKINHDLLEYNRIRRVKDMGDKKYAIFSVHRSPLFRICYRFNPPDDARSEDLIHEIYTHIEPEGHYKVGDPFPILYRIYKEEFDECVDSMPFPLPFDDVFTNDNLYYHDKCNSGIQYVQTIKNVNHTVQPDLDLRDVDIRERVKYAREKYNSASNADSKRKVIDAEKVRKEPERSNKDYSFRERAARAREKYGASELSD